MIRYEVWMGLNTPTGCVSDEEFAHFLHTVVNKAIQGYSILHADGIWKGIREPSRVLIVVDPPHEKTIEEIAKTFKRDYDQESVMITRFNIDSQFV